MTTFGLVLAGGRSSRFGSEKALARLEGRTLLEIAVERLARDCAAVAVNAPAVSGAAAQAQAMGWPLLSDAAGDPDGPLSGIRAGLRWAAKAGVGRLAVIPCDAPARPDDLVARLLAELADAPAAAAETDQGVEPLCAVWTTSALDALGDALDSGAHPPVHAFLDLLGARLVRFADAAAFLNVNTPGDLAIAAR